jgi:hypothetical protein
MCLCLHGKWKRHHNSLKAFADSFQCLPATSMMILHVHVLYHMLISLIGQVLGGGGAGPPVS